MQLFRIKNAGFNTKFVFDLLTSDPSLFPMSRKGQRRHVQEMYDQRLIVGEMVLGDGNTPSTGRQGVTGEAMTGAAHGHYYEASSRGRLAFAAAQAGVATTTSISTTAILSLYNPLKSGRRLSLAVARLGYYSGTLGAGPVFHCVTPAVSGTAQTTPASGTALTSYWSCINNDTPAADPVGLARTASTVVAPIIYGHFCSLFAELATTANGIQQAVEDLKGEITLDPGGSYQMQSVCAAGSTPLVCPSISWEEVPTKVT